MRVTWRPLDELDPIPVRVDEPRYVRSFRTSRAFDWTRPDAGGRQPRRHLREVVDLDGKVTESGSQVYRPIGRPVHQLERHDLFARKLEHRKTRPVAEFDRSNPLIAERTIELKRRFQVSHTVRRVKGSQISAAARAAILFAPRNFTLFMKAPQQ